MMLASKNVASALMDSLIQLKSRLLVELTEIIGVI
jgi:hypothetical protein